MPPTCDVRYGRAILYPAGATAVSGMVMAKKHAGPALKDANDALENMTLRGVRPHHTALLAEVLAL